MAQHAACRAKHAACPWACSMPVALTGGLSVPRAVHGKGIRPVRPVDVIFRVDHAQVPAHLSPYSAGSMSRKRAVTASAEPPGNHSFNQQLRDHFNVEQHGPWSATRLIMRQGAQAAPAARVSIGKPAICLDPEPGSMDACTAAMAVTLAALRDEGFITAGETSCTQWWALGSVMPRLCSSSAAEWRPM
eukprot:jgi/Ulvmu1/6090/UM027_0068.1